MTDKEVLGKLMVAMAKHRDDEKLRALGQQMFDMYTAEGYPPDLFLDEMKKHLHLNDTEAIFIVSEYQTRFLEHRRKSGMP